MTPSAAASDGALLATLDLSSDGEEASEALAAAFSAAARGSGFFYLVGHGVEADLLSSQLAWTRRFFALDHERKAELRADASPLMRGYSGLGRQILDPEAPPDWKESFMIGRDLGPDHPLVRRGVPFEGPNPWPRDLPGFRAQMEAYTGEMIRLGRALTRLLARSLGLEPDALAEISEEPNCSVRLLRYPAPEAGSADNQLGSGAHTDWGLFTLLLQDDEGGLEILGGDGVWAPAPPRPGALVVNLGDMVPRLTNGRYASNLHRVRRRPGDADRYSVACFFNPNAEYRFASLKICLRPGEAADPPLSFAEHVRRRAAETAAPA